MYQEVIAEILDFIEQREYKPSTHGLEINDYIGLRNILAEFTSKLRIESYNEGIQFAIKSVESIEKKRLGEIGREIRNEYWNTNIYPLINEKNKLISNMKKHEDGSPILRKDVNGKYLEQINEINKKLKQYPQYVKSHVSPSKQHIKIEEG